jgi:hypothetical protein
VVLTKELIMSECEFHEEEEKQIRIYSEIELNGSSSNSNSNCILLKKSGNSKSQSFFTSPLINLDSNDNCNLTITVLNSALSSKTSSNIVKSDKDNEKINNSGVGKASILQGILAHEYSLQMKNWIIQIRRWLWSERRFFSFFKFL